MDEIRSTLVTLSSYEPNTFPSADSSSLSFDVTSSKQSYCAARDRYLNQRMEEMMLEYVSSYSNDENGFMRPDLSSPCPTDDAASKAALVAQVTSASQQVSTLMSSLQSKTAQFKDRLSSLSEAVASFDSAGVSCPPPPTSSDYDVTPDELRSQEVLLADLLSKKESMRARLSELKAAESQALKEIADIQAGSYGPSFPSDALSTASLSSFNPIPSFASSAEDHTSKIASLRELADWYAALRSALESLSGVIVSSITPAQQGMTVRVSLHTPPLDTLVMKVGAAAPPPVALSMSVVSASLECPSSRVSASLNSPVTCPLPSLADVVSACNNMDGPEGLRFVVRESSALLHGLHARLTDVETLKKRYVLKSGDNFETITVQIPEGQGVFATIKFGKDYSMLPYGDLHVSALQTTNVLSPFRNGLEELRTKINVGLEAAQESKGVGMLVDKICKGVKDVYSANAAGKAFGMPR